MFAFIKQWLFNYLLILFLKIYYKTGAPTLKSSTIRYINLPIMNNTECAIRYAKYSENFEVSIVITPTEFCAQAQAMNDVCEGNVYNYYSS